MQVRARKIDPTNLTLEQDKIILGLILEKENKRYFEGSPFFNVDEAIPLAIKIGSPEGRKLRELGIEHEGHLSITLTHSIIRTINEEGSVYNVCGLKPLGAGMFGTVYEIIGRIALLENKRAEYKGNISRVAKLLLQKGDSDSEFKDTVMNEYELLKRSDEYGVKVPVFFNITSDVVAAIIVMRRFYGKNMEDIINSISTRCGLVSMLLPPKKDGLDKLPISSNAAYIYSYSNQRLFYVNKAKNELIEIPLDATRLDAFVEAMMPTYEGRILTENELKQVTSLTEHVHNNTSVMSVDQRLQCTWQAAFALRKLHKKNIAHRDYKHANVICNLETGDVIAIDLGSGCDSKHYDHQPVGTPVYSPPELLLEENGAEKVKHPLTQASDRYALGWLVALIWGASDNPALTWLEARTISLQCMFVDLFQGISDEDLAPEHKQLLSNLIHELVKGDPNERCSIETFLKGIEQIWLDRKLQQIDPTQHQSIRQAYHAGAELRKKLDIFDTIALNEKMKPAFYCHGANQIFIKELKDVDDSPEAISALLFPLNIKIFKGLTTKSEVLETLSNLGDTYKTNQRMLLDYLEKTTVMLREQRHHDEKLNAKVHAIRLRVKSLIERLIPPMTLDEIARHNRRCEKYIARFKQTFNSINHSHLNDRQAVWDKQGREKTHFSSSYQGKLFDNNGSRIVTSDYEVTVTRGVKAI
jgi:serine/threonine protein kinase